MRWHLAHVLRLIANRLDPPPVKVFAASPFVSSANTAGRTTYYTSYGRLH